MKGDHYFLAAREALFDASASNVCVSKMLDVAINDYDMKEARWLREKLCVPLVEAMANDSTPVARYYYGRALIRLGRVQTGVDMLKLAFTGGYLPAAVELASLAPSVDIEEKNLLNNAAGFYLLAHRCRNRQERFEYFYQSAIGGYPHAFAYITYEFYDMLSPVELAIFGARYMLLTGDTRAQPLMHFLQTAEEKFYAGRELDGYTEVWCDGALPRPVWIECIAFYQSIAAKARRAALQTIVAVRSPWCRGSRDLARLIGKAVYETRYTDTECWVE
jgi:hypothetical protein